MAQSWLECKCNNTGTPFLICSYVFHKGWKFCFGPSGLWSENRRGGGGGGGGGPGGPSPGSGTGLCTRVSPSHPSHSYLPRSFFFLLTQLLKSYPRPPFLEQWLQGIARQAVHVVFYYQPPLDRSKLHRLWLLSPRAPPRPSTVASSHDLRL